MVNFVNGQAPFLNDEILNLIQQIDTDAITLVSGTTITNDYEIVFNKKYQVRKQFTYCTIKHRNSNKRHTL